MRVLAKICIVSVSLLVPMFAHALELAIVSPRGAAETNERWSDLGKYLTQAMKEPVVVLPLAPAKVIEAAQDGRADIVITHSPHTVQLLEKVDGQLIATVNGETGSRFGGVIVAKKGAGIQKLADLRGKKVMSMKFKESAGGYLFQVYELQKAGIDVAKDLASLKEGDKQDALVMAVKDGKADAAFVRTGLLEDMVKEGKIRVDEFDIVNSRNENGFNEALSTSLYPEWCVTALSHVPADKVDALKGALLKLAAEAPAARKAQIKGFIEPIPLDSVKELMKALAIAPYDQ